MTGNKEGECGMNACNGEASPLVKRKGGTVLFVGNLPFGTPWQRIKDWFRVAGGVRYTDLIADRDGRPKGSAIVTMVSAEDAERAIAKLNESEFEGRRLIVRYFHDDHSRRPRLVQRDLMPGYNSGSNNSNTSRNSNNNNNEKASHKRPPSRNGRKGGNRGKGGSPVHSGELTKTGAAIQEHGYTKEQLADPIASESCIVSDKWINNKDAYAASGCWIYVNNLPLDCTVKTLELTFAQVSEPLVSQLLGTLNEKNIGRLLMKSKDEAQHAITEFDGVMMASCEMKVGLETDEIRTTYKDVLYSSQ